MSLYGAINIDDPKKVNYFGRALDIIKEQRAANEKIEEAKKKQQSDRTEKLLEVSGDGGFEAHQAVTDQRVKWLKDNMDSASDESWFKVLNETLAFDDEAIQFKKDVLKEASELRSTVGVVGANSDLDRAGYYDDRSPEDIDAGIAALSDYGAFGDVNIEADDGSSLLSTGLPLSATFDKGFLEPNLKEVPVKDPQAFGVGHDIPEGVTDIEAHIRDRILNNNKFRLNAIRWADSTSESGAEDSDEIDDALKIERYAKEAAKHVVKPQKKEDTAKKNKEAKFSSLVDGIQKNLSLRLPSIPAPDYNEIISITSNVPGKPYYQTGNLGTFSEGSVSASYAALTGKKIYVGGNFDEDAVEGDESKKYEVSGVYLTDDNIPVFQLRTSKGDITVESNYNEDLYKQIDSQMTAEYGKDALIELLRKM